MFMCSRAQPAADSFRVGTQLLRGDQAWRPVAHRLQRVARETVCHACIRVVRHHETAESAMRGSCAKQILALTVNCWINYLFGSNYRACPHLFGEYLIPCIPNGSVRVGLIKRLRVGDTISDRVL
jgi:hypothetical protein